MTPEIDAELASAATVQIERARVIRPGGFWRRLLAYLIDTCIVSIVSIPFSLVVILLGGLAEESEELSPVALLLQLVLLLLGAIINFLYYGWFYKYKGATPGKMVLNLRVVNESTGTNIGFGTTFLREVIGKFLSSIILLLGYIMAGLRSDKRGLHDLIAGTRVIMTK